MLKNQKSVCVLTTTLMLIVVNAVAETNLSETSAILPGRLQVSATASQETGIFSGDVMQPFSLDATHFVYGDMAGDYGTDDTYLGEHKITRGTLPKPF